jgi:hypothetical protein
MKKTLLLVATIATLGAMHPTPLHSQTEAIDLKALAKKARPAVLLIVVSDRKGTEIATATGFLISSDGKLLTNHHVIDGAASALAKAENGALFPVEGLLADDPTNDLVLLKLPAKDLPFLPLNAKDKVDVGTRVAVIGSPLGLEGSLSEGIISAFRESPAATKMLQMTAAISPGSSGSPVLNLKGEVIGIASSQMRGGQLLNLAVPVECATRLLAETPLPAKPTPFKQSHGNQLPPEDYLAAIKAAQALKGLPAVRVKVVAPDTLLSLQIKTDVEIRLQKAGLTIDQNAPAFFLVTIYMDDVDPAGHVRGKYGASDAKLYDAVTLKRATTVELPAPTWSSSEVIFRGPPDTVEAQARQIAADSTEEFVNEFLKQNQ